MLILRHAAENGTKQKINGSGVEIFKDTEKRKGLL
jgi:hypothetical protein